MVLNVKVNAKKDKNNLSTNNQTYMDVTEDWLKKSTPNSHRVKEKNYFEYKNVKYMVDDKNVVLDYLENEKRVAEWLENIFGGEIFILPRINIPEGIRTADYLFKNEYWDLKEIKSTGKRVIDNRSNGNKKQSNNFILDFTDSKLPDEKILFQIKNIYDSKDRYWVDKIIIKRGEQLIKVFIKNRD